MQPTLIWPVVFHDTLSEWSTPRIFQGGTGTALSTGKPATVQAPDAAVTWHGGQPRALGVCGGQRRGFLSPERETEGTAPLPAQGSGPSQTGIYPGAHVASEKKLCRAILWWKKGRAFSLKLHRPLYDTVGVITSAYYYTLISPIPQAAL